MSCCVLDVQFIEDDTFNVSFSDEAAFNVDFVAAAASSYMGTYEVTPSQQTQELETANKIMEQNVIVHPIPSNYGLITYNGSIITVS